jgi:adenylate cyclase
MEDHLPRKLAAILYADVAGYSLLTGDDEEGTHRRLSNYLDLISERIKSYQGNVVHYAGDAVLADFSTVTEALSCAVDIQSSLKDKNSDLPTESKLQFRIGINLGEVIVDRDDIYGDGVNVAARLETLAEPGGICISHAVRTAAGNKLPIDFHDIGKQTVKNIKEPVLAYHVLFDEETRAHRRRAYSPALLAAIAASIALVSIILYTFWVGDQTIDSAPENTQATTDQSTATPEKRPAIAVLPFQTLSEAPGQDYFSDGVTNDIITDLSKFSNLMVIASNSVFTYKGKSVDVKQVGEDLGVRYVLEGSIQKVGNRVRINAQLIDAATNSHLWADRYDFELDDIFKVQDKITSTVVTSLQVILTEDEKGLGAINLTDSIEAYDLYLRGKTYLKGTKRSHLEARKLFDKAIKLDPGFAAAYAEKSFTYFSSFIMPMSRNPKVLEGALKSAQKAVEADDKLPLAHARLAWAYFSTRQHAKAIASARRAVALGPNDAEAFAQLGNILNWSGKPVEGKQNIEKAMRLNPFYPYYYLFYLGQSHYLRSENERAIELMNRVITRAPTFLPVRRHLAVLYIEQGELTKAKAQTKEILRIFPGASIQDSRARCLYRWEPKLIKRFLGGLRKAGMPEGRAGVEPISM